MCYIFIRAYLCLCGSYGFYGSNNCTLRFRRENTSGHALSHARKELKVIMLNSKIVIIFSHGFPFVNARFFAHLVLVDNVFCIPELLPEMETQFRRWHGK